MCLPKFGLARLLDRRCFRKDGHGKSLVPQIELYMIEYLKKYGLDLVAAFWLLVVLFQYVSSYFYNLGLDFQPVYYVMVAFTAGVVGCRVYRMVSDEVV